MAIATDGLFCAICNAQTEAVIGKSPGADPFEDDDRTLRAPTRLASRLYLKAIEQSLITKQGAHDVSVTPPLSSPVIPVKKHTNKKSAIRILCGIGLIILTLLLIIETIGYRGTTSAQQQAEQEKGKLDNQLFQVQQMGVPASFLQSLLVREQQVDSTPGVLMLFHNRLVEEDYQRQYRQYHALLLQVPSIVTTAVSQLQAQAQQNMQELQDTLAQISTLGIGNTHMFAQHLSQEQLAFTIAHLPADYLAISSDARATIAGLNAMAGTFQQLTDFAHAIDTIKQAHLDVTSIQLAYQNDQQLFASATQASDFQRLSAQVTVQYQQVIAHSIQMFHNISTARLSEFQAQVQELQRYGGDGKTFQARLAADQVSAAHARTVSDKLAFFHVTDVDIAALHAPFVRAQARYELRQFHREVEVWGKAHLYYDLYDRHNYMLDNGYMSAGLGSLLDKDLASARTTVDFETVVGEVNNALFNLHLFEMNYKDQTAYNSVHASDLQMITHYALQKRQVLMVSLGEQVMRVYQNGKLVRAFAVTTGRQELPSLPGVWSVQARRSPVIFQAGEPRNSPYWFPDTPIQYALLYHVGGYFVHDAPWRGAFGPGTQFPHRDPSGTTAYNFDGSHGCINLDERDAGWVYAHTDWNTAIVIY